MRVAFDPSSTRGRKTGIGIYTENLIRAMRKFVPELELVELPDDATADQRTDRRIVREQFAIPMLAGRARPDILHLTGFAAPWRAPCPVILNAHDLIGILFARDYPPASRFYWSRYLPFTLRFARQLIVLSQHTKSDLGRLANIPANRISVIPPGRNEIFRPIDDAQALQAARAEYQLPERFLLFVSTLEPRKGVDTLIEAYSQIAGDIVQDLVLVGRRGRFGERFSTQVQRAGLTGRAHFIEYIPANQLPLVYNLASAFVFPSRYEGFGLTPLEAMACGTPVISSNASSLPEVIGDAGILVSPDDVEGFCGAVMRLLASEELQTELRIRGLERARSFSWERAAKDTMELYKSIMKN